MRPFTDSRVRKVVPVRPHNYMRGSEMLLRGNILTVEVRGGAFLDQ